MQYYYYNLYHYFLDYLFSLFPSFFVLVILKYFRLLLLVVEQSPLAPIAGGYSWVQSPPFPRTITRVDLNVDYFVNTTMVCAKINNCCIFHGTATKKSHTRYNWMVYFMYIINTLLIRMMNIQHPLHRAIFHRNQQKSTIFHGIHKKERQRCGEYDVLVRRSK